MQYTINFIFTEYFNYNILYIMLKILELILPYFHLLNVTSKIVKNHMCPLAFPLDNSGLL